MKIANQFKISVIAFCAVIFFSISCFAASDPVSLLSSIADQLIAQLKQNQASLKSDPNLVYSLANKIVVPHADIDEMAKKVLPPPVWGKASPGQRSKFEDEFTTLLVRTYAAALADYKDQTIRFLPVRGGVDGKTNVQINSVITRPDGPSISVNYRMILKGSEWKLYDLNVEGVSLIESFRAQFADQLSQGTMDDVIRSLANHNRDNAGSSD